MINTDHLAPHEAEAEAAESFARWLRLQRISAVTELLDDATLARMTTNAYREAAHAWQEARTAHHGIRMMLIESALSADAYYIALATESRKRASAVGIVPAGMY